MPSKKKKYNARFPAGRIKKIMQSDEDIGKVAQAVPVIISRTLELFVESLLNKTLKITNSRNAKTLSTSHLKQCIMTEQRFDFLQELVKNIPDISVTEEAVNYNEDEIESSPERQNYPDSDTPYDLTMSSTSTRLIRDVINGNFQKFKNSHTYAENDCNIKIGSSEAAINTNTIYDKDLHAQVERHSKPLRHESVMAQCCPTPTPFAAKSAKTQAMRSQDILEAEIAKLSETETQSFEEEGHEHLKTEVALRKHRRQRKSHNIPKPTPSVIRHTTSLLNTDHAPYPPVKLYCTNSAPAVSVGDWLLPLQHLTESRSVPCDMKAVFPLIPGPFVSIDFCNKPVVKIDYSNLCLPNQVPTSGKGNARGFNFNAEPIINIDLSNIVTSSGNDLNVTPMPTFFNPLAQSNIIEESMAQGNSNSSIASAMEHSSSAVTSAIASSPSAVRQHDSLLELDEDYDNI